MRRDALYPRTYDPREFVDLLTGIDLHPANATQCDSGWALAAELISPNVAGPAILRRIQARTEASVFVQTDGDGEVVGVSGILPLRPEGLEAMLAHRFAPKDPPNEFLCAPGDPMAAMYPWAFAARTRRASAAAVSMMLILREHYPDIPFFTRAVTPAGAKVVRGRMGYAPYPDAPDDLLWNPVRPSQERAA